MASSKAESDAPGPPRVPVRTTSRSAQEPKPPAPPPKDRSSVEGDASRQAGIGPNPVVSSNESSRHSDFEVIAVDNTADDSDSTVSIDEELPPLPPLPVLKGNESNGSTNHDVRRRVSYKGVTEVEHNPNPRPGPSIIQKSRVIDLPVERKSPSELQEASSSTTQKGDKRPDVRKATSSSPSSAQEAPAQNPPIFIPNIPPLSPAISPPANLSTLASGLEGNYVDEFGNILDWHGHVLGRVAGDLPSMVGRPVSSTGEILNDEGKVVGYVAENDTLAERGDPQPLEGVAGSGLRVDHLGNILDSNGTVVGRMKNNNAPQGDEAPKTPEPLAASPPDAPASEQKETCACGQPKPSAAPSPSEIYLDVKSTNDGIQLIIKIPTIFNRTPVVQIIDK